MDNSEMGPMVAALKEGRMEPDQLIDETGNVPADVLYSGFFMMAPTTVVAQNATLMQNLWNDEFVKGFQAVGQWTSDQVPFPGAAFSQVVHDLICGNALMSGRWRLGGREIDFTATDAAVLNVMAGADRVVPRAGSEPPARPGGPPARRAASEPAAGLVGRPERREELVVPGGHATFGTGRSAFKHTLPGLAAWIGAHSETEEAYGDQAHRVG